MTTNHRCPCCGRPLGPIHDPRSVYDQPGGRLLAAVGVIGVLLGVIVGVLEHAFGIKLPIP